MAGSDNNELNEEVEMVLQIFGETCERVCNAHDDAIVDRVTGATKDGLTGFGASGMGEAVLVHLPLSLKLQIVLPAHVYPDQKRPEMSVVSGCNTRVMNDFSAQLRCRARDELALGGPMLVQLIVLAQQIAGEMESARNDKLAYAASSTQESNDVSCSDVTDRSGQLDSFCSIASQNRGIKIWSGPPITDRKSKFVAHMARVSSLEDVKAVVSVLRSDRHIACAAHPTIWAYRYTSPDGVLHQDCDDDGEHGASARIIFLLDQLNVNGFVIVVTRWFGGILLGPDRFKHIMEVAKNMLLTISERSREGSD